MEKEVSVVPGQKRISAPKRRSGCGTCKLRHIRCSEEKPKCHRCMKSGIECVYATSERDTRLARATRVLAAKPTDFPICTSPGQNLFDNSSEWAYFQRFCGYAREELSNKKGKGLWNRIVLQATQGEPSLRHAATAIGALELKSLSTRNDDEGLKLRREFAYREYHKAIVGLRKTLSAEDCNIRTRLLACILFACFESYHGNFEVARRQIFVGVELMAEHVKRVKETGQPRLDLEFEDYFAELEIQACSWGDCRSIEQHIEKQRASAEAVQSMPSEFNTVLEASYMISTNMLRAMHLAEINAKHANVTGARFVGNNWCDTSPAVSELDRVLATFKQWYCAFEPLYKKSRSLQGSHLYEATTMLRLQYFSSFLWVAAGSPYVTTYYRRYETSLMEVVRLCKTVIEIVVAGGPFSIDQTVILPLSVVGLNYRHRAVRREAIAILGKLVRREGVWDAAMLGKIMSWMAEIEEEGLGDEIYVPEDGVATIIDMKVDESQRSVFIRCSKGVIGCPGESKIIAAKLYW